MEPSLGAPERGLGNLARCAVAAVSLVAVGAYATVAAMRVGFAYELQWIEGGILEATRRFSSGGALYVAPGVDFTSFPYPPLYLWASAALGKLTTLDLPALRGLSIAASVATMAVAFALVRGETRRWEAGLAAAGFYAAAYGVTGAWFDLARVDSLFMFLVVAGLAAARFARGHAGHVGAGLVLALAFLTKQTALLVAVPVLGYLVVVRRPTRGVAAAVAFVLPVAASTLALDLASDEWYRFFLFRSLANHGTVSDPVGLLARDLGPGLGGVGVAAMGLVVGSVMALGSRNRPGTPVREASARQPRFPAGFYAVSLGALVSAGVAGRVHSGGFANNLMPIYCAVAVAFGLGVGQLARWRSNWWWQAAVVSAVVGALVPLRWDLPAEVPSDADRRAGDAVVTTVAAMEGEVWVVSHPALATAAGKPALAHGAAVGDILRGDDARLVEDLEAEIAAAVRSRRFGAIVFDGSSLDRRGFPADLERFYRNEGDLVFGQDPFDDPEVFRPVTDARHRPTQWWVRRAVALPEG